MRRRPQRNLKKAEIKKDNSVNEKEIVTSEGKKRGGERRAGNRWPCVLLVLLHPAVRNTHEAINAVANSEPDIP